VSHWVKVAATADIPLGQMKAFSVDEEPIVICNVDGDFYACQDMCSHQELPLDGGQLTGCVLTCPWHGATFDVTNGAALSMPAVSPIVTYPVKVEGNEIFVELP